MSHYESLWVTMSLESTYDSLIRIFQYTCNSCNISSENESLYYVLIWISYFSDD